MKHIFSILFLAILCIAINSCSDETYNLKTPPVPSESIYAGLMEVSKTDDIFAKTQILATRLEAGEYKIIFFPKKLELRSYYVKVDNQGNIDVEYKLREEIAVEAGYDGTVFGELQIVNTSRSKLLHVPVAYVP